MQKVNLFLILLVVSLVSLIILFLVMLSALPSSSTQPDWISEMWSHMGGMMGGSDPVSDSYFGYFGILFLVVVGIAIFGVIGLVYFVMFPEIKTTTQAIQTQRLQTSSNASAYDSVLKTLNDDEKKVIMILKKHEGKYLQKHIRTEAELSRLKTHRILARFAERGIVTLKKIGNTNEVLLAEWLK